MPQRPASHRPTSALRTATEARPSAARGWLRLDLLKQTFWFALYLAFLAIAGVMPAGLLTLLACCWGGVSPVAGARRAAADLWLMAGGTEGEV